jgi:signal transduction protein with GAF and PtsI domain
MAEPNKINREIYKLFIQTITDAKTIELMAKQLTQIIVGAMGIKGATLLILDPVKEELEILASAGLSMGYVQKGPILANKSVNLGRNQEPVVIADVEAQRDQLQYPDKAREEGIKSIVSQPIAVRGKVIGALRFYNDLVWLVSDSDRVYIEILAQNIGMALMYFRVSLAVRNIKDTVNDIHSVWL